LNVSVLFEGSAMRRGGWLVFMGVSGGVSVKMIFLPTSFSTNGPVLSGGFGAHPTIETTIIQSTTCLMPATYQLSPPMTSAVLTLPPGVLGSFGEAGPTRQPVVWTNQPVAWTNQPVARVNQPVAWTIQPFAWMNRPVVGLNLAGFMGVFRLSWALFTR
jgi:hypothetical protein